MRRLRDLPQGREIDGVDGRLRIADRGTVYRLADARITCRTVERSKLDAAVADPTNENLEELRASTDKLMRALGRILIEIARQQSAS